MSSIVSPTAGTRNEPIDSYRFVLGTTAVFKTTFLNEGVPTDVDTGTTPEAKILAPNFLIDDNNPLPRVIATVQGTKVPGQQFEFQFSWDVPANSTPLDNYVVSYYATLGGVEYNFGDEYFTLVSTAAQIGTKHPAYATVDDVRKHKFNIDDYLPSIYANDLTKRNQLIEEHIRIATQRLREELSLFKSRANSENYKLFTIYYTVWSILLASRGEDGSSVADQNLMFWKAEWDRILQQEKREGVFQGLPLGRG